MNFISTFVLIKFTMLENYLPQDLVSIVNSYTRYIIMGVSKNKIEDINTNKVLKTTNVNTETLGNVIMILPDVKFYACYKNRYLGIHNLILNDSITHHYLTSYSIQYFNDSCIYDFKNNKYLDLSKSEIKYENILPFLVDREFVISVSSKNTFIVTVTWNECDVKHDESYYYYKLYHNNKEIGTMESYDYMSVLCNSKYVIMHNKLIRNYIEIYDHKFNLLCRPCSTILGFIDDDRILIEVNKTIIICDITHKTSTHICRVYDNEFLPYVQWRCVTTENSVIFNFPATMIAIIFRQGIHEIVKLNKDYYFITTI